MSCLSLKLHGITLILHSSQVMSYASHTFSSHNSLVKQRLFDQKHFPTTVGTWLEECHMLSPDIHHMLTCLSLKMHGITLILHSSQVMSYTSQMFSCHNSLVKICENNAAWWYPYHFPIKHCRNKHLLKICEKNAVWWYPYHFPIKDIAQHSWEHTPVTNLLKKCYLMIPISSSHKKHCQTTVGTLPLSCTSYPKVSQYSKYG